MHKEEILKAILALGVHQQREILMDLLPHMCKWAILDPEFRDRMMDRCGMPPELAQVWLENIKKIMAEKGTAPCCG